MLGGDIRREDTGGSQNAQVAAYVLPGQNCDLLVTPVLS